MATQDEVEVAKTLFREKERDADGWMKGCTSYLQRKMQCGYNHAANIMLHLEAKKFISEPNKDGHRKLI